MILSRVSAALQLVTSSAFCAESKTPIAPGWTVETFRCELEHLGDLCPGQAPKIPDKPTPEAIRAFLTKSHAYVTPLLHNLGIPVEPGLLCAYDPNTTSVAIRFRQGDPGREVFQSFTAAYTYESAHCATTDLSVFEGPAPRIRALLNRSSATSNHKPAWDDLNASMASGEIRFVSSLHLNGQSGQVSKIEQSDENPTPQAYLYTSDGLLIPEWGQQPSGQTLEVDPYIGSGGKIMDVNLCPEIHYAAPEPASCVLFQTPTGTRVSGPVTHTFQAKVTTQLIACSGQPRILGVWSPRRFPSTASPEEKEAANRLQIAMLTPEAVTLMPPANPILATWIEKFADKPPVPAQEPPRKGDGMEFKIFHVPPSFLSTDSGNGPAGDPFKDLQEAQKKTAREILEKVGVTFPPGALAIYQPSISVLFVRNTKENLELVRDYMAPLDGGYPSSVVAQITIVQAPSTRLRQMRHDCEGESDHSAAWKRLVAEATPTGPVQIVGDVWLEARSGQVAKVESGRQHRYFVLRDPPEPDRKTAPKRAEKTTEAPNPNAVHPKSSAHRFETKTRLVGTTFEFEPVAGTDARTLNLNVSLEFHYAPPSTHLLPAASATGSTNLLPEAPPCFHATKITSQLTLMSGTTRLIGVWKPSGTPELDGPDILQAAFLQATVVPVDEPDP